MMAKNVVRIGVLIVLVVLIGIAITFRNELNVTTLEHWVQEAKGAAPIIYLVMYALFTILFLPGSILTLLGGALFGPWLGTFLSLLGATIGATVAFLISRYIASDWIAKSIGGRLKQLLLGVEREGWRFVAFVRLVPIFPFNLLNYALGLTKINLSHYVLASFICMLPGSFAYTYLGYAGKEVVSGGDSMIQNSIIAIGLIAIVAYLPRFIKKFKNIDLDQESN